MKPCSKNRKLIAWLALDALEAGPAGELRTHLETCAGCRGYFEEISKLTTKLAAAEPVSNRQPSGSFHQRLIQALHAEEKQPAWQAAVTLLRAAPLRWRVALPVIAATIVLVAVWLDQVRHRNAPEVARIVAQAVPSPAGDLAPTIFNYQMAANRSLDDLDRLLDKQAEENLPPAPVYTASMFSLPDNPE